MKEQLQADPFSGVIFCFRAKRTDRVKLVSWDGTGLCLFAKRLVGGKFHCAAHRGRREAAVGATVGGADRGPGLDARAGAAHAGAGSCPVACGEVNQAPVWLWQIGANVLCPAREPTE